MAGEESKIKYYLKGKEKRMNKNEEGKREKKIN